VLDDATPKQIAAMAGHVIGNTGQSCNALSRMIVPAARYEEVVGIAKAVFEKAQVTNANGGKMGQIGPLASQAQFDKVLCSLVLDWSFASRHDIWFALLFCGFK
jgi:aldehyde dehydrogenase (NAD+)